VASGMFVINPPFTLKDQIRKALDMVGPALARGSGKNWAVESA
jgi:23S rRNA (adenine2030-N6)-methyltransferase